MDGSSFKKARLWYQLTAPAGGEGEAAVPASALPIDGIRDNNVTLALISVFLKEENPTWSPLTVARVANIVIKQDIQEYLRCCINTFILRSCARLLQEDPCVDPEDATSIAMYSLLQRVAEAVP